ncbi:MAG: rRNA maturation RNase YbeY [bacterium]|nr:rRNA maturation RNase YbeY [bacterium]
MHVVLEYTGEIATPFSEDFFQTITSRTLEECQFPFLQGKDISLNVVAVSPEKIQGLNVQYRGKDSVTDILSFGEYADREALEQAAGEEIFLGEIFFCPSFIERAAEEDEVTFEREMIYIFSHGVLHLAGFDHEEEMFAIQERVTDILT